MRAPGPAAGFTLVELVIVVSILGVLAAIATPNYLRFVEKARTVQAVVDIDAIEKYVAEHQMTTGALPTDLGQIGWARKLDPWGNPYAYLPLGDPKNRGRARKDRWLVPINTDYDLYSLGADGMSAPALTAETSRDDVIRGSDGGFVGLAVHY